MSIRYLTLCSTTSVHFRFRNRTAARIAHVRYNERLDVYKRRSPKNGARGRWLARRLP